MYLVTLDADSGRTKWVTFLPCVLHMADDLQGLQQESRGQGSASCMGGSGAQRTGQEERNNQNYEALWEVSEKAKCLACEVSYKGEVGLWSVFSYCSLPI